MNNTIDNIKVLYDTLNPSERELCLYRLTSKEVSLVAPREWNIYEASLLVELYFSIQHGTINRLGGIARLSDSLRQTASKKYLIDEQYRNNNGIRMCLDQLLYIDTNGEKGLKNASKLFQEMMQIYSDCPKVYEGILEKAHHEIL